MLKNFKVILNQKIKKCESDIIIFAHFYQSEGRGEWLITDYKNIYCTRVG